MAWYETLLLVGSLVVALGAFASLRAAVQRLRTDVQGLSSLPKLDDLRGLVDQAAAAERIRPLEEAVRRMGEQLARLPAPVEPKDLLPLQERIELLARQIEELRLHVVELRSRPAAGGTAAPVAPSTRLLRALEERGFERVHILGEIVAEDGGDLRRVPVEASRAGMSFKGYVTVEDGQLVEVALKPLTEVFP